MRKLPIGIQSFKKMREDGYIYVDKTPVIKQLADTGTYYFLSRPRRFGKSLLLDTMHQAFLGKKELFEGLYLYDNWNWDKKHPVLYVNFGDSLCKNSSHLQKTLHSMLDEWGLFYSISYDNKTVELRFKELIRKVSQKYNEQVVVLIDEYDKPILDNITNREGVKAIRDELKNFYSVLKGADKYLKFVFLTGVSKFSKVSVFSGLNNLKDLTINNRYSAICGYTQEELESVFEPELVNVDMDKLKLWYNGYSWGPESVYNPFDILQFLDSKQYKNYWFETGTPTFLIDLLIEKKFFIPKLEYVRVSEIALGEFDIENINIYTLLFQSGYLTIKECIEMPGIMSYVLSYPNLEVKSSLTDYLLTRYASIDKKEENRMQLYQALLDNDIDRFQTVFKAFFASIPHDWYRKNKIDEYEGFYASVFYSYFSALGLNIKAEDPTNEGQIDMTVLFEGKCYIFELKVNRNETQQGNALQQIKDNNYAQKFTADYNDIYLIGVEFNSESRNITYFEWEQFKR